MRDRDLRQELEALAVPAPTRAQLERQARARGKRFPRCSGTKRRYTSAGAARRAHSAAGVRVRAYPCPDCGAWHVTHARRRGA